MGARLAGAKKCKIDLTEKMTTMSEPIGKTITAQGHGSPVPVQAGVEAGPTEPSTNNCGSLSAAYQAERITFATGKQQETGAKQQETGAVKKNPFGIGGLSRTPPRERTFSLGSLDRKKVAITSPELERSSKRRRELYTTTEGSSKVGEKMRKSINLMVIEVEALDKVVKENQNTKREIKVILQKMQKLAEQLSGREAKSWMGETQRQEQDKQGEVSNAPGPQKTDMATQTPPSNLAIAETQTGKGITQSVQVEKELEKDLDEGELQDLIKMDWPEEVYKKCKATQSQEDSTSNEADKDLIILMVRDDADQTDIEITKVLERSPVLQALLETGKMAPGKMICSVTKSEIITEDSELQSNTTQNVFLTMLGEEMDKPSAKTAFINVMKRIAERSKTMGMGRAECVVHKNADFAETRKMLEYACRKTDLQIVLRDRKKDKKITQKKRGTNKDMILLKPLNNATYAEVISHMKSQVGTKGVTIDRICKRKDNSVELRIKSKDDQDRKAFRISLSEKMETLAEVKTTGRLKKIMVLDIDETIQEGEVQEVLKAELGNTEGLVGEEKFTLSKKGNRKGLKYAFLSVEKSTADLLLQKRTIGKDWNRWRIKEVEQLIKCYKCNQVGHMVRDCKKTEDTCYKCGEEGHKRADCQNPEKCYLCNSTGHKAESMRCPQYRTLITVRENGNRVRPRTIV